MPSSVRQINCLNCWKKNFFLFCNVEFQLKGAFFKQRSNSASRSLFQITTLVNHKDCGKRTTRARAAIHVVGQTVENAVQKFVDVGQQIALENPELASEMLESCEEAKVAGQTISSLTSGNTEESSEPNSMTMEKSELVNSARSLLSAITKVLILADSVMVKRLVYAAKKVRY